MQKDQKAEVIATHLEENTWKNTEAAITVNERSNGKVVEEVEEYNPATPTIDELKPTIKKLQRRKAEGPDEIPMEFFKEINEHNLQKLNELISDRRNNEDMPPEETRARVVTIFKKGDTSDFSKYRPISLLNAAYNIFTAILVHRISQTLNKHLQKTQFGFRRHKSRANAIFLIRRMIDTAERSNKQKVHLVLLAWEKAFDKLIHASLFKAMDKNEHRQTINRPSKNCIQRPTIHV